MGLDRLASSPFKSVYLVMDRCRGVKGADERSAAPSATTKESFQVKRVYFSVGGNHDQLATNCFRFNGKILVLDFVERFVCSLVFFGKVVGGVRDRDARNTRFTKRFFLSSNIHNVTQVTRYQI